MAWLVLLPGAPAAGPGADATTTGRAPVRIDAELAHSTGPEDVVLEVAVTGGFGRTYGQGFRLFGDGRLEESRAWNDHRAGSIYRRDLPLPDQARERLLRGLVAAGVPGATDESLLEEVRSRDPRIRRLVWSEDCAKIRFALRLLRSGGDPAEPIEARTDLQLECTHRYRDAYPDSKRLVALADLIDELMTRADSADRPPGPVPWSAPERP